VLRILRMSSLDNSPVWTYILTDSARRCLGAKLSLNIMMTTFPITGKLVTAESRRQPKMEPSLLHLRRRPVLLLPTLHLNPLELVLRPKKPANLLPMPFRKTSHRLQATTSLPSEPFSCAIVCLPDMFTTLSRCIRGAAGVGRTSFSTRMLHLQLITLNSSHPFNCRMDMEPGDEKGMRQGRNETSSIGYLQV